MSKLALLAGAAAGVTAIRRTTAGRQHDEDVNRWLAVTVNRPFDEVDRAELPEPLTALGERVETRVRPAGGDKGTEIAARLRDTGGANTAARLAGDDPRQEVRSALRQAKSLLETGEVLQPDPPSTHPGPGGKLVQLASERAGGEGRL